jgi:hypothetical protein
MATSGFGGNFGGGFGGGSGGGQAAGAVGVPVMVQAQAGVRMGTRAEELDWEGLATVECCGLMSVALNPDVPLVLTVRRPVLAVFATLKAGGRVRLHVAIGDVVYTYPVAGTIALRGLGAAQLAVSGFGDLELLVLGAL